MKPSLGGVLRERRTTLGLSLEQASRKTEAIGVPVSPSQILRIENGGTVPRADHLVGLARAYGLPAEILLDLVHVSSNGGIRFDPGDRDPSDLLREGEVLVEEGRYPRARARFEAALAVARLAGDDALTARSRLRLGWLDIEEGNHATGLFHLAHVAECSSADPEDRTRALPLLLRALVLMTWMTQACALERVVRDAAESSEADEYTRGMAWSALGLLYRAQGAFDRSADAVNRSIALVVECGRTLEAARLQLQLVEILEARGDLRAALDHARVVERAARKKTMQGLRVDALVCLGRLFVVSGQPRRADRPLREAAELAEDLELARDFFRARYWMARAFEAAGQKRDAHFLYQQLMRELPRHLPELEEARMLQEKTVGQASCGQSRPVIRPSSDDPPVGGARVPRGEA